MKINVHPFEFKLSRAFSVTGQKYQTRRNYIVEIEHEKAIGFGEAALSTRFGDTEESALRFFKDAEEVIGDDPSKIREIMERLDTLHPKNRTAKCAIDIALYDIMGKIMNKPLHALLGLERIHSVPCGVTIYIESEADMVATAKAYPQAKLFKVKMDSDTDIHVLQKIHDATGAKLWIDVNEGWSVAEACKKLETISKWTFVELVEQPIAALNAQGMATVRSSTPLPIYADEDVETLSDLRRLEGVVDGVNVKISKQGGIYRSIEMITEARKRNFRIILGSRIESAIAVSAASHLIPLVDYVDIDPRDMIENDPYDGTFFDGRKIVIPDTPGIGIVHKVKLH